MIKSFRCQKQAAWLTFQVGSEPKSSLFSRENKAFYSGASEDLGESDWEEFEETMNMKKASSSAVKTEDEVEGDETPELFDFDGLTIKSRGKFSE